MSEMPIDSITEEIRAVRHDLAAQFDNDVSRIFADVREKEASDGRVYVSLPKRPAGRLKEVMDKIGRNAESKGLTPEILDTLVRDVS